MESSTDIFFDSSSRTAAVTFSAVSVIILTPTFLGIISFEKNKHHRTLINQLMASIVWSAAIWNWTVQPLSIYRAAVGPIQPEIICRINSVLRNALPMHAFLLLNAMMLIKYCFLFHTKNPTAIQDDFWNRYLNVVFFILANLSQIVHVMSPGPESENFLICVGRFSASDVHTAIKKNYSVYFVLTISAAIYLIFGTKYFYWKFVLNKNDQRQHQDQGQLLNSQIQFSPDVLVSTTTNGLIMVLLSSCFIVITRFNRKRFESLQVQYSWFYALQLYLPPAIQLASALYFAKNKQLRNHLKVEFLDLMSKFYPKRKKPNQIFSVKI